MSGVIVGEEEREVTVEVTAKDAQGSSLAANNGLTTVTYDASALELKDVRISGDYTARLTAAGAVTFGYIAAAALEAGAPVATLTFAVKEGNTQNTYITVTHKEANGEKPGYVEQLPVEFTHTHTELRNEKVATCTEPGYTGDTYCKDCGLLIRQGELLPALGHDYEAEVTAPTCTEQGYTTHTCSRCGDSYVDSETPALGHKCAAYTDIPTDWAKEGICFVIENGLMVGTTSTTFAPKDTLTRAMLVTVLYRMAGSPAVDAPSGFTDVADGQWYSDAIAWAAANGIVNGVGNNRFAPSEPVTREQLAAIFFRYAKAEAPEADVLSGYPDAESVSTYARDAMAWAVSTGLVTGSKEADGTYLAPQGLAAREQAAAILMRYVKANA